MFLKILLFSLMSTTQATLTDLSSCVTTPNRDAATASAEKKADIPFAGFRKFEIYPGFSGTGTPATFVQILDDGEVIFHLMQENQASGEVYNEEYKAGRYTRVMKCYFRYDKITRYYEITPDKIYQVDEKGNRLSFNECCDADMFGNGVECPCESDMYEAG